MVIVSALFWLLTLAGSHFAQQEVSFYKVFNYECGFDSLTPVANDTSNQLMAVSIFLLIYDAELLLLLPLFFTIQHLWIITGTLTYLVLAFVFISCFWDSISYAPVFAKR